MIFQNLKKNERKYEKWNVSGDLEYMRTAESFSPVSYTHLDVYKRQVIFWRLVLMSRLI